MPVNKCKPQTWWRAGLVLCAVAAMPATASGQQKGILSYLQKEPMTLFDAGMKSLRRQALDATVRLSATTQAKVTSRLSYKVDQEIIEFVFVFAFPSGSAAPTRDKCVELRRKAITDMLRIGRTEYDSALSVPERIRRRIGGQFAHEPTTSMSEVISIGEWIGAMTHFAVVLKVDGDGAQPLTCQDVITESLSR